MRLSFIIILTILIAGFVTVSATIINVPADYDTIQVAINFSDNGDTVLVQPGTYMENINFNGHKIVLASIFLTTDDTSYISNTIIDGNSSGSVIIFENHEDSTAKIIGFTIQNGNALNGGGIFCYRVNPIIEYNIIRYNEATDYDCNGSGGGIKCVESSPIIRFNSIYENFALGSAGGIGCIINSNALITDNIISNNFTGSSIAGGGGGGISIAGSNPIVSNNIIEGNSTIDTHISVGGGIYVHHCNPIITNNHISGNFAGESGGGMFYGLAYANGEITNNVICNNLARRGGGLLIASGCNNTIIRNNTISNNTADVSGGGLFINSTSSVIMTNTIIWRNSSPSNPNIEIIDSLLQNISYCDIQGGFIGEEIIDCDPLFCNPTIGNYYLADNSCCLNAGEGGVDIGAFGASCTSYPYFNGDANMYNGVWPPQCIGSDVTYLVGYFRGYETSIQCKINNFWASADVNGDCLIIGSDVTRLVNYFRSIGNIEYCPAYPPRWPSHTDLPVEAPDGWPNCEMPVTGSSVIPTGSGK